MLEPTAAARYFPKAVIGSLLAVIALNVIAVILGSFESVSARWGTAFSVFETLSAASV